MLAAVGADNVLVTRNESVHLVKAHGIHIDALARLGGLDELVRPLTGAAALAVNQGV